MEIRGNLSFPFKCRSVRVTLKDTNKTELEAFLGIVLPIDIEKQPTVKTCLPTSAQYRTLQYSPLLPNKRFELMHHNMLDACKADAEKILQTLPFLKAI